MNFWTWQWRIHRLYDTLEIYEIGEEIEISSSVTDTEVILPNLFELYVGLNDAHHKCMK